MPRRRGPSGWSLAQAGPEPAQASTADGGGDYESSSSSVLDVDDDEAAAAAAAAVTGAVVTEDGAQPEADPVGSGGGLAPLT